MARPRDKTNLSSCATVPPDLCPASRSPRVPSPKFALAWKPGVTQRRRRRASSQRSATREAYVAPVIAASRVQQSSCRRLETSSSILFLRMRLHWRLVRGAISLSSDFCGLCWPCWNDPDSLLLIGPFSPWRGRRRGWCAALALGSEVVASNERDDPRSTHGNLSPTRNSLFNSSISVAIYIAHLLQGRRAVKAVSSILMIVSPSYPPSRY